MREIELKVIPSSNSRIPPMVYRDALKQILYAPPANGHLLSDQILPRHEVAQIIKALPEDASVVMLEEEQYRTLTAALKSFPWGIANEAVAEFIKHINEAPKLTANKT